VTKKQLFKYQLFTTVFLTGATSLAIEVLAMRLISPFFGNTIYTVSSVLSVVLAALSLGYYFGGRIADKNPSFAIFNKIISFSGILVFIAYFLLNNILPSISYNFSIIYGPIISAILFFLAPSVFLGIVSPYAIKLYSLENKKEGVGSASGTIFFYSTLGSIFGSLLTGFYLIPNFGVNELFMSIGIFLIILGLLPSISKKLSMRVLILILLIFFFFNFASSLNKAFTYFSSSNVIANVDLLYQTDGIYEKVSVFQDENDGQKMHLLMQDASLSGASYTDTNSLVFPYTKYIDLYKATGTDVKNVLFIGGGSYAMPQKLSNDLPNSNVSVVEIEPELFDIAQNYFGVPEDTKIINHIDDGRRYLQESDKTYDYIFSDVYYSLYSIPFQFTTKQFYSLAKSRLNDNGIFLANLIGSLSRQTPSLLLSQMRTFKTAFPNSYFFAVDSPLSTQSQNVIFLGINSDDYLDLTKIGQGFKDNEVLSKLSDKNIDVKRFNLGEYVLFTDDYAPTEYYTSQMIKNEVYRTDSVSGDEMIALIRQQLSYGPRYPTSSEKDEYLNFLTSEIGLLSDKLIIQKWQHKDAQDNNLNFTNIVAQTDPENDNRVILATHYDSKRFADLDKKHPEEPVPGANDSASGVSVLTEIARYIKNNSEKPKVGVDFIFFDGEEGEEDLTKVSWKPLGSTYFAEHLDEIYPDSKPNNAIVIDMVCDRDLHFLKDQSSADSAPELLDSIWKIGKNISSDTFSDKTLQSIYDDHTSLNNAGIPSILLIDFDYPWFHTTADTLDKCSPSSLEIVAKTLVNYLYSI
jgi:spermidine synthase